MISNRETMGSPYSFSFGRDSYNLKVIHFQIPLNCRWNLTHFGIKFNRSSPNGLQWMKPISGLVKNINTYIYYNDYGLMFLQSSNILWTYQHWRCKFSRTTHLGPFLWCVYTSSTMGQAYVPWFFQIEASIVQTLTKPSFYSTDNILNTVQLWGKFNTQNFPDNIWK